MLTQGQSSSSDHGFINDETQLIFDLLADYHNIPKHAIFLARRDMTANCRNTNCIIYTSNLEIIQHFGRLLSHIIVERRENDNTIPNLFPLIDYRIQLTRYETRMYAIIARIILADRMNNDMLGLYGMNAALQKGVDKLQLYLILPQCNSHRRK